MAGLRALAEKGAEALKAAFSDWDGCDTFIQLGWGFDAKGLLEQTLGEMPLQDLPGMPDTALVGNMTNTFRFGHCGEGRQILVLEGHRYPFEGHGVDVCALPVCAAILAGVRRVLLLEAGFSLRDDFLPGTWIALTDYINGATLSPLIGNTDLGQDVFMDVNDVFSQHLNSVVVNAIDGVGLSPRLGICQTYIGPELPSPAEVSVAQDHGADVCCPGILPEALAGAAMGAEVSALVLAGESAPTYRGKRVSHKGLLDAAEFCSGTMMRGLGRALKELMTYDNYGNLQ